MGGPNGTSRWVAALGCRTGRAQLQRLPLRFQQNWDSDHHVPETQARAPGLAHSSLRLSFPT